jgi:hypothetical protein
MNKRGFRIESDPLTEALRPIISGRGRKSTKDEAKYAGQRLWIRGTSNAVDIFATYKILRASQRIVAENPQINSLV